VSSPTSSPDPSTPAPPGKGRRRPPALVTSVVFGAIGTLLLLTGLIGGSETLVVSAVGAGAVSLVAVLVWREQLIAAWRPGTGKQGRSPGL